MKWGEFKMQENGENSDSLKLYVKLRNVQIKITIMWSFEKDTILTP